MAKGCNNASNKRSNSSKPYDASNSFVKKVASRVTGLIPQTSWLSGWFSTPDEVSSQHNAAHSAQLQVEEDSSEDQSDQPPPTKRLKLPDRSYEPEICTPSPGTSKEVLKSSQGDFLDMSSVPGPSGQQRGGTGNFVSSTPAEQERKANGDDCSESAESTSGCSSLEPQMNRAPGVAGQQALPSRFLDDRFNYPSYLQSPRSLFLDRSSSSRNNQSASRRKPSFSVTSLNSSLFGDRSLNETMVNSPFYSGRTMYGGASSSPYRRSLASSSFTSPASSDKSGRHIVRVKPSPAQSTVETGMSETARRILATLEQFSTPLLDAKRIPVSSTTQPVLASSSRKRGRQEIEEPRIILNPPRSPQLTRKGVHWAKGPPINELSVPSTPDTLVVHRRERIPTATDERLLRQKERLQDSTTAARRLANSVPVSNIGLERTYTLRSEEKEPSAGKQESLKMKQPRTKLHESNNDKRNDSPIQVILPKVALPITALPTFDIPVAKPAPVSPCAPANVATKSSIPQSAAAFTFASPIVVSSDLKPISPVAFVFSKPDPVSDPVSDPISDTVQDTVGEESATPATGLNFLASVPSRSDKEGPKRKSVTVKENGSDAVVFSLKPPSELRTGSVMDILGKGAKDTKEVNGSVSLMDKFKPAAGTWECDKCLIRNKADLRRCAACTNARPAASGKVAPYAPATSAPATSTSATSTPATNIPATSTPATSIPATSARAISTPAASATATTESPIATQNDSSFGAQFKLTGSDMWECSACMVRNKSASCECVACGTAKPGAVPPSTSNWGDKFKQASNTWECEACMVRNSSELTACQACTTKRPGAASTATLNATSSTTSSWGDKFKKAEGSWDCSDCMITNKSAALKCVACGAKKAGTQEEEPAPEAKFSFGAPAVICGFTFGIKPGEKTEVNAASPTGFKIGAPATSIPTTGFTFGIPPAAPATTCSVTTASPTSSGTTTTTVVTSTQLFSFGVPKSSSDTSPKSESTQTFSQTTSESCEPSRKRKSSGEANVTTSVEATPRNAFTASSPTPKSVESTTPHKTAPLFGFSANSSTSLFKFGGENAATTNSPKATPAVEEPNPNPEKKPFFGACSTPALNSTFAFGQSRSETPKPTVSAALGTSTGASTDVATPVKAFTFGQSSSERVKSPNAAEPPKPADVFASTPKFMFGQSTTETGKSAESQSKPSVTDAPEKGAFNFQPSSGTVPKPLGGFGNPSSGTPMFGSATNAFPTFGSGSSTPTVSAFGSTASANPTVIPTLASPIAASSTPMFGASNSIPTFGSSFGSTEKTEPKAPNLFTFGAPSKPAAAPFTFGAPAVNGPTFGAQPVAQPSASKTFSAFNAAPTNSAPAVTPAFGGFTASHATATAPAPAAPAPATPAFGSNTNSLFGNNTVPAFGAPSQVTLNAPPPTFGAAPTANAAQFSFSNTSSSSVFTFGGSQPQQNSAPAAPFSFTAKPTPTPPEFNPNAAPNFNFTAGGTVNFTATPGEVKANPPRVIKKAMRRTQPR